MERKINKHWRQRWLDVIKHDYDYSADYILNILVNKLELMHTSISEFEYLCDEDKNKIILSLNQAILLGHKLQDEVYDKEMDMYFDSHATEKVDILLDNKVVATITETVRGEVFTEAFRYVSANHLPEDKVSYTCYQVWDVPENEIKYKELCTKKEEERRNDITKFFGLIAENFDEWWY